MNIEAMAREAGDDWDHTRRDDKEFLAAFATLVRAKAMREAAGICEAYAVENDGYTELHSTPESICLSPSLPLSTNRRRSVRYRGVDYPDDDVPPQRKPTLRPLPCPFCGRKPQLEPKRPDLDGNAWGQVACVTKSCIQPSAKDGIQVAGEYGTGWYMDQAIKRWNKRAAAPPPATAPEHLPPPPAPSSGKGQ